MSSTAENETGDLKTALENAQNLLRHDACLAEEQAREILKKEFPETDSRVRLHLLDEKSRRVGQAVAAASLPEIPPSPHPAGASE